MSEILWIADSRNCIPPITFLKKRNIAIVVNAVFGNKLEYSVVELVLLANAIWLFAIMVNNTLSIPNAYIAFLTPLEISNLKR